MASKICKIVYFDEDSVTDYVQIVAGGTLEKTTELLNSSDLSEEQKADVSAKGGIGGVFKALLGWEASASGEVSAGLALNRNKMVKNIVKNTILTDFLPVVLMLYGPSGVGKTESAKSISKSLGGELLRIQFSMMQTSEAYDYVFGAEHSKSSFARDMMGRESNVILIDEFDKVNPALYNAFYELFDEGKYVDTNYSVELGQAIFLLTCNFSNENEIKKALGPAMFSRIGCCVEYADLTVEQKQKIVNNWYDSIMASLKDDERVYIETTDIHEWFLKNAERYDNIRILKSKMENAIFEKLTDHFIIMTGSMAEGTQDRV